jgi:pimeloyl-ACP methyl ester carboxylesterase
MKMILWIVLFSMMMSCKVKDTNMESIFEKTFIQMDDIKIGMFIKGNNINNPILLFLHGGPGMPEYGLTKEWPTYLEEHFTVCWYEQRGAGISYNKNIDIREMAIENIISDTVEVTNYLRNRFSQNKIYLMAHSWGSLIGLKTVKKYPELYHAYIGIAQITNQLKSEKIAYEYMLEQYKSLNNKSMVNKLESFKLLNLDTIPIDYAKFRDRPMHELGIGSMRKMDSVISGIFLPIMRNGDYTLSERVNIWRSKAIILNKTDLWEKMIGNDFTKEIVSIEIPIYLFHGIFDYTVNYSLTI